MIVGSGDIAKAIIDREGLTFFAKGVSNSLCADQSKYNLEFEELKRAYNYDTESRIVYFSSLSIYEKDSPYTRNKLYIESMIKLWFKRYCIVRLGNITWGTNPNTIINTFKSQVAKGEACRVDEQFKYLCTKDELNYWLGLIPEFNTEMNIPGERVSVKEIYLRVLNGIL